MRNGLYFLRRCLVGGEREMEVKKEPKAKSGKVSVGNFRIHQNNGEIHIHDDTDKMKVAVPVAAWWKMWDKLKSEPGVWTWIDTTRKTKITVESFVDQEAVDVKIDISAITFSDTWDKINTFTKK